MLCLEGMSSHVLYPFSLSISKRTKNPYEELFMSIFQERDISNPHLLFVIGYYFENYNSTPSQTLKHILILKSYLFFFLIITLGNNKEKEKRKEKRQRLVNFIFPHPSFHLSHGTNIYVNYVTWQTY